MVTTDEAWDMIKNRGIERNISNEEAYIELMESFETDYEE
jgi:hypothetical protein